MERTNITINGNVIVTETTTLDELLAVLGTVEKAEKTPTAKALREKKREDGTVEESKPLAESMGCKAYANGYAVYTNDTGTTVLWLPDCSSFTFQFDPLREKEKEYLAQRTTVDGDVLGNQPWFMAVLLRGDHQVEINSMNRQFDRKGAKKELWDEDETEEKREERWNPGYHYENPETAYIRKETLREQLDKLTDKQREVFLLYHQYGYTQQEIAEMLGIAQQVVARKLSAANAKIRNAEKLF